MSIFGSKIDFSSIQKRVIEAEKKFNSSNNKNTSDFTKNVPNNAIYEKILKYLYNTITSIKNDNSNPNSKNYFIVLEKTKGDYKKRDIKIYNKVNLMVSFIKKYTNDITYKELNYSLAGIYVDAWDILQNPKYVAMFKKSFEISDKKGELNTSLTVFKLAYLSTVFFIELATLHLVEFELDIYNGIDPKISIINIMNKHASFMKNVVFPMIQILAFYKSMNNPISIVTKMNTEEEKVYKELNNINSNSKEVAPAAIFATAKTVGLAFLGNPIGLTISIIAASVISALFIFSMIRYIIYWAKTLKIDTAHELELKAELLDNNILVLKEKLKNTNDPKEKARLEDIIRKQQEYVEKWKERSKKILQDEYEANYIVEETIKAEDERNEENTSTFEIVL